MPGCEVRYRADVDDLLTARGRRALRLADGMLEWRLADLPVAAGVPRKRLPAPAGTSPVREALRLTQPSASGCRPRAR